MSLKERLSKYIKYKGISNVDFEKNASLSNGSINKMGNNTRTSTLDKISNSYPDLNINWLRTGEGLMLMDGKDNMHSNTERNLIPLYDNTSSIGGVNAMSVSNESVATPSDYIDTGDWFKDATAAIRHYGMSMIEYPQGCILALKEVKEVQLVVWGRDYVIETDEYRITKRIQRGDDNEHIKAYSTNSEVYPDGRLVHEPLDVSWKNVRRIYAVLGYVVKKNGGSMFYNNHK